MRVALFGTPWDVNNLGIHPRASGKDMNSVVVVIDMMRVDGREGMSALAMVTADMEGLWGHKLTCKKNNYDAL